MTTPPEAADLASERVTAGHYTLRPWDRGDVVWVFDACQDAEIQRWTHVPRPYRAADAVAFIDKAGRDRRDGSAFAFAISRTDNDELLGAIDLRLGDEAGIGRSGYWVAWHARGHGVAAAALDALAQWGFERLGLGEIRLEIASTNTASRRVAEQAGFQPAPAAVTACPDGDQLVPAIVYVRRATSSV